MGDKTKHTKRNKNDLTPIFDLEELKHSTVEENSEVLPTAPEIVTPLINNVTHLNEIKEYANNIKIGETITEANPAFSLYAEIVCDDYKKKMIIGIITQEILQITSQDLEVQLENGKLLIPQISEFTAIFLAMKLRDVVDNILIGPSNQIYESKTLIGENNNMNQLKNNSYSETEQLDSEFLVDAPNNILTSNTSELTGFKIESILSALSTSKIINKPEDFDNATDEIRNDLCKKAFKLKANGLLAISFTLKNIPASDQSLVIGSATAVLLRKL